MYDAKSMAGFLSQELDKIDNSRAQNMVEELQPYRVEIRYVPGPKMEFADYGSRHPIYYGQHKLFDSEPGSLGICVRSNRVVPMESTDIKDPKVETLAAMAVRDPGYMRDVEHIKRQADLDQVEKTSELRKLRSCWDELSVISLDRGKLIIRGDREILIPNDRRKQLVDQLHTTHLSYQGMMNLARNKFFWPLYWRRNILAARNARPIQYRIKVSSSGSGRTQPPGCWRAKSNKHDILMVKDSGSGLVLGKLTKNQTTEEAFHGVLEWALCVGISHE